MKSITNRVFFLMLGLFMLVGCGGGSDLKEPVVDTEILDRALFAEADIYAPEEYQEAAELFDQMMAELDREDFENANNTSVLVVEAVNKAIGVAKIVKDSEK